MYLFIDRIFYELKRLLVEIIEIIEHLTAYVINTLIKEHTRSVLIVSSLITP